MKFTPLQLMPFQLTFKDLLHVGIPLAICLLAFMLFMCKKQENTVTTSDKEGEKPGDDLDQTTKPTMKKAAHVGKQLKKEVSFAKIQPQEKEAREMEDKENKDE